MYRLKYHTTDRVKKFRNNITKNNINYTITHFIIKDKIHIIIKYSNIHSDEIYEFSNFFSFEMLQDISEYFTQFKSIHQISIELDKLLKNNDIIINEFKGNLILSIVTKVNNRPKDISLNLFHNKLPDFKLFTSRAKKSKSKFGEFLKSAFRERNKTNLTAETKKVRKFYDPLSISKHNENIILSYNTQTQTKDRNTISNKINEANTVTSQMNSNYISNRNNDLATYNNKEIKETMTNIRSNYLKSKEQYKTFYNNAYDENNIDFFSRNAERGSKKLEESKNQKDRKTRKIYGLEGTMSDLNEFQTNRSTRRTFINTRNEFSPENNKNNGINFYNNINNRNKAFSPMSDKKERKLKYVFREIDNYYETLSPKKLGEEKKVFEVINEEDKKDETENTKIDDKKIDIELKEPGLPMVEPEDLDRYVTSNIFFTKKELKLVKTKITKGVKGKHAFFDLLYRASIDGDFETVILSYCEGLYPQLILFHTSEGARFGVYIEKEKVKSIFGNEKFKEKPDTSFLVSLNSLKIYDIEKGQIATGNRSEKLCFGRSFLFNDNGSNWFIFTPRNYFLDIKCMIGDKKSTFGNINTNEIVGPKKDYYLKDVEIFQVRIETNLMKNKSSSMKDIKS